jgi:hypothetical protein
MGLFQVIFVQSDITKNERSNAGARAQGGGLRERDALLQASSSTSSSLNAARALYSFARSHVICNCNVLHVVL